MELHVCGVFALCQSHTSGMLAQELLRHLSYTTCCGAAGHVCSLLSKECWCGLWWQGPGSHGWLHAPSSLAPEHCCHPAEPVEERVGGPVHAPVQCRTALQCVSAEGLQDQCWCLHMGVTKLQSCTVLKTVTGCMLNSRPLLCLRCDQSSRSWVTCAVLLHTVKLCSSLLGVRECAASPTGGMTCTSQQLNAAG